MPDSTLRSDRAGVIRH